MTTTHDTDHPSFGNKSFNLRNLQEWDYHNRDVLKGDINGVTDENTAITKNCIEKVNQTSFTDFKESTEQLKHRQRHIYYWKCELEKAIREIDAEIEILEKQRQQLKNAMDIINVPEFVTYECIDLRGNRMEADMIFDEPQRQLYRECTLIQNIKKIQRDLLNEVEKQMKINTTVKEDLEMDWSEKRLAFGYETKNVNLETKSNKVKDSAGATKLSEGQSTVDSWEHSTENILRNFQNALENTKNLRSKVDAVLINAARDIRSQDVQLNRSLHERIAQTEKVRIDLENQLRLVISKIVETENIMQTLNAEMRSVAQRLKVAQTRLNTKSYRPNTENCREGSLISLIEEVRDLSESLSLLQQRHLTTENLRAKLIEERSRLENEIMVKKKSVHLDNERCLFLRSHFESAEKLCGY
ncbi:Tektin-4 [Eumeta japonica]|uniref:Tektin n=1 Tax=Eumeta variegata TaxID=151549 RepID=A0A4C1ZWE5_EUMVA|nr:Tektin-4 [Eumeta japonica]